MTFLDTNIFMYAVGGPHPLREQARVILRQALERHEVLVTSAEVLQELLHAYIPVDRTDDLDEAWRFVRRTTVDIWPLEVEDVELARSLRAKHPGLSGRDLVHLASCTRRGVTRIRTFDRGLRAALEGPR